MKLACLLVAFLGLLVAPDAWADPKPPKNANEVIPGLWQGARPKAGKYGFDVVVLAADEYQPKDDKFPDAWVVRARLSDVKNPETKTWPQAIAAAIEVAQALREGKTALVTCGQGYNRSGLVTALALRLLDYSVDEAVRLIRAARGQNGLRNRTFLRFVRAFDPQDHVVPQTLPEDSRLICFLFVHRINAPRGSNRNFRSLMQKAIRKCP